MTKVGPRASHKFRRGWI